MEQKDSENTVKMNTPILLTISMHMRPTRFLEFGPPNAEYNSAERPLGKATGINWGDNGEIEEAMAATDKDEDDDEEDPLDKAK